MRLSNYMKMISVFTNIFSEHSRKSPEHLKASHTARLVYNSKTVY